MFRVFGVIHPAEVLRQGRGPWLDRLQGEVGLDGVVLQLGTRSGARLEVGPAGPVVERAGDEAEFRFDPTLYAGSRCRPAGNGPSSCAARQACAAARDSGLEVRVELAVATMSALAEANPMFCCRNALDDRSRRCLCTMSEDARAYVRAFLRDVAAALRPERIDVSTWFSGWTESEAELLGWPRELTERERRWLRLCFCESCQQVAQSSGIDVEVTRRGVRSALLESLRAPRCEPTESAFPPSTRLIEHYIAWRTNALAAAWVDLARHSSVSLSVVTGNDEPGAGIEDCPRVVVVRSAAEPRPARHGDQSTCSLRVPCTLFWESEPSEVMALFTGATEAGVADVEIDRIGLLRETDLDTLRRAIRFARRIS